LCFSGRSTIKQKLTGMRKFSLMLAGLAAIVSISAAQKPPECSVSVSKTELRIGESLKVTFKVENNRNGRFTPPEWNAAGWASVSSSQSSSYTLSGGEMISSATYEYTLMPQDTGLLEIPAGVLESGNREISTDPISIYVKPGKEGETKLYGTQERRTLPSDDPKKRIKTIRL
jgi:hypothetical protein